MTEAMPFLQKYDITFLRPPTIMVGVFVFVKNIPNTYMLVSYCAGNTPVSR